MATSASFNQEFRAETWTLFSVGVFLTGVRLTAQTRKLGIKGLRSDDWVILSVIPWYTLLVVSLNEIVFGGGSNFITPEELAELTPESRQARIVGSKWVLVSEEMMVLTIWTCKVCMLLIYQRLMRGLSQMYLINGVLGYVAVGFVAAQIALFTDCRPFSDYWSVPAKSDECWSYFNFEIVEGTFNVSSNLFVLLVAIPLIAKLHLPIQQKAALVTVFGMGFFVIVAAILTKVFSLDQDLVSYSYLNWYFREASVSVFVVNVPAIYALFRDTFPAIRTWGYKSSMLSTGLSNIPNNNWQSLPRSKNELRRMSRDERAFEEELESHSPTHSHKQILPR